jgi:hypothetical protein
MARFYKSPRWKHLVTKRDSEAVTELSGLAMERRGRFELGAPATMEGLVPADDFRVWFPASDQVTRAEFDPWYLDDPADFARLSEGMRLMYSFRRDGSGPSGAPWGIRHAGPVLTLQDNADPQRRLSRFVAYDPWQYLYLLPARNDDPDLNTPDPNINPIPGENGIVFQAGTTGDAIVCELLRRTIEEDGLTYIDAGTAFGGTSDYAGTIETTDTFTDPVVVPRGASLGQAWDQMVDTGTLDIVLTPIYDPLNRPGYCAELNIFVRAGGDPLDAYANGFPSFRWDRTGNAILEIERIQDGRERANRVRGYVGGTGAQDAPWTGHLGAIEGASDAEASWNDTVSSERFGEAWLQETYIRQARGETVGRMALDDLYRLRAGLRTWRFKPTPEFAPRPFQDYQLGSYIGFYHSRKLREEQWWLPEGINDQTVSPRVLGFTITLSNDSLETVAELDFAVDHDLVP